MDGQENSVDYRNCKKHEVPLIYTLKRTLRWKLHKGCLRDALQTIYYKCMVFHLTLIGGEVGRRIVFQILLAHICGQYSMILAV